MLLLIFLLFFAGCKKSQQSTVQTDPMNLTGDTGRNLTLEVSGLETKRSKTNEHRVCAFGLAGNETLKKGLTDQKLVCSSTLTSAGTVLVKLKHLPYPAYITLFHDENLNGVLDFASFNVVIARKDGPIEGVGHVEGVDLKMKFSKPVWVEVGENQSRAYLNYENSPFWKYVSEQGWQYLYGWYLEKAFEVNHKNKQKNPFCTKAEDCI
jgi:hypothetical protein